MSEFREAFSVLTADDLADVANDVVREQAQRQPQKAPADMSNAEFARWSKDQISQAEQAKAAAPKGSAQ